MGEFEGSRLGARNSNPDDIRIEFIALYPNWAEAREGTECAGRLPIFGHVYPTRVRMVEMPPSLNFTTCVRPLDICN